MISICCNKKYIQITGQQKININGKEKNFQSKKYDQRKLEKNNETIAPSVLHAKKEKIYCAYVSKHNSNREKQVTLIMIPNGEKQQKH